MKKPNKRNIKQKKVDASTSISLPKCTHCLHHFSEEEINIFRTKLLCWYDQNKRVLPWRTAAEVEKDENKRGYSVWVSEIMLQQTQVSTVINYYKKWMERFPTIKALADGSLEEVHKLWAGLGYYSRGTRLLEGSKKIQTEMAGELPRTSHELMQKIPGVGRYTASAIASIAYREKTGVVDGNVIRVMTRLRLIGSDTTSQETLEHIWTLANQVVDEDRPGDFNQAMMELGAVICTPKNPSCSSCPVNVICKGYERASTMEVPCTKKDKRKKEIAYDIEECAFCLPLTAPYLPTDGVHNYPRKKKKIAPRLEKTSVYVVYRTGEQKEFLMFQRPLKGLLANLWEFPSRHCEENSQENLQFLEDIGLVGTTATVSCGEVFHQFSHISQTYVVNGLEVNADVTILLPSTHQSLKWVTEDGITSSAVSTAMKKVFQAWKKHADSLSAKPSAGKKRKLANSSEEETKRQPTISSFFKKSPKGVI